MTTVASLFDGIGGTPLAARLSGAECLWCSEIEEFPQMVTKHHFPSMKHYGDITKINGAKVEPVDIIVGGSPCQDLSVAGKRQGMKHSDFGDEETTRSGLFMEQIRIVKEMRNATETNQPRFMVWENVPGAFISRGSGNKLEKGDAFRIVLEETAKIKDKTISIPRPVGGKWANAGCIMGDGFSISWRTYDAKYWGVAQRRRRIYLVADFGGQSAPEILFEREGVSGDIAESSGAREGVAGDVAESTRGSGDCLTPLDVQVYENHGQDSRITGPLDVSPTVSRKYGTGGNNVPLVARMQSFDGDYSVDGTFSALKALDYKDATDLVVTAVDCRNMRETEKFGTLQAKENGGQSMNYSGAVRTKNLVRRLTPLECERLQGYPDGWTDIPGASDTTRYKALGNSFAMPNILFVMQRCVEMTRCEI